MRQAPLMRHVHLGARLDDHESPRLTEQRFLDVTLLSLITASVAMFLLLVTSISENRIR